MTKHYKDYFWKEGRPQGLGGEITNAPRGVTFKIISDPYFKRTSIEKYNNSDFTGIIYDSALLNFRHLKPAEQMAWQKTLISEDKNHALCHIRNQDDRLVIIEEYIFENHLCRQCRSFSPQGILLSVQKMYYSFLKHSFNGVVLFDPFEHVVMYKRYQSDENNGSFTDLIEECWDMTTPIELPVGLS